MFRLLSLAAVLPIYYSQVAGATLPSEATATAYWSLGLSISLLIVAILSFLTAFLLGGRQYAWFSLPILGLFALFALSAAGFYLAEKRSNEPILCIDFFRLRGFSTGNGLVIGSSRTVASERPPGSEWSRAACVAGERRVGQ